MKTCVFQLFSLFMQFWRTILQPKILHEKRVETVKYVVEVTSMRLVSDQIKQNFISLFVDLKNNLPFQSFMLYIYAHV